MAGQAQGQQPKGGGHGQGDGKAGEQAQPGREAVLCAEHRTGVGADADKGRLAEGGHAGNAGHQH
ncbi:hypothetical protein D3C76_1825430 [compost metagenome]